MQDFADQGHQHAAVGDGCDPLFRPPHDLGEPRRHPCAESGDRFAARKYELFRIGEPPPGQFGIAPVDLVETQSVPVAEVDFAEPGVRLERHFLTGDEPDAFEGARQGADTDELG